MPNFTDISYLSIGTSVQRQAHEAIIHLGVMETLARYQPLVAGTIPIDINIAGSDIDIICEASDHYQFGELLTANYGTMDGFKLWRINLADKPSTIASFKAHDMEFEIFGQDIPSRQQNAFRHMLVEYDILQFYGDDFKQRIIKLKENGIKTEPAFCQLLGIEGNPYVELLNYRLPEE